MRITNAYYLIVDVEATCSDDGTIPRHEMEIVEIAAVMQNSRTFEVEAEFNTFVRPLRHPELTEFCTRLTRITTQDVSDAPGFPVALDQMEKWMHGFKDSLFCSWGDYDRKQFIQDCEHHRVPYPFAPGHLNLKTEFAQVVGIKKTVGMSKALRHLGMELEGKHHRGLDDARNMARIVRRLCTSG